MALRCFALTLALCATLALASSSQLRATAASSSSRTNALSRLEMRKAKMVASQKQHMKVQAMRRASMVASQKQHMKVHANLATLAASAKKYGMKLPWANLDADGGEEYERGNQQDDESDPKLFSEAEYEHTDARDDADVAENEDYQDDTLNHGDDSLEKDDDTNDD